MALEWPDEGSWITTPKKQVSKNGTTCRTLESKFTHPRNCQDVLITLAIRNALDERNSKRFVNCIELEAKSKHEAKPPKDLSAGLVPSAVEFASLDATDWVSEQADTVSELVATVVTDTTTKEIEWLDMAWLIQKPILWLFSLLIWFLAEAVGVAIDVLGGLYNKFAFDNNQEDLEPESNISVEADENDGSEHS